MASARERSDKGNGADGLVNKKNWKIDFTNPHSRRGWLGLMSSTIKLLKCLWSFLIILIYQRKIQHFRNLLLLLAGDHTKINKRGLIAKKNIKEKAPSLFFIQAEACTTY